MRLHDILYGGDTHRVFHNWWEYARREYLPLLEGRGGDTLTQYYDPLIDHHHLTGLGGGLGTALAVAPQKREAGQLLFEAAAEALGWTSLDPVQESSRELTTLEPSPRNTLIGLALAREYGNDRKFNDPTVHSVDFPAICLSQAWYDVERGRLVVSTDSGIPGAAGQPTSFRVSNMDVQHCHVIADGQLSRDWRVVGDEIEINTTVGEHTFLITTQ